MYDIDLYTYKDRPIIDEDSVKIYPLNDQGMTKYLLQKESHVCTYLDKIKQNPSILNDFTSHNNGNSEPFNSPQIIPPIEVNVKEPKINDKPVISSKIHPQSNRNAKVNLYKKSMLSNSMDRLSKKQNDYYNQLFYSKKPDLSENTNTYFENVQRSILTSRKKNLEKYASLNNNNNKQQRKYENVQSPSHLKLNKYFKSCHKKMTFEDIFGYPYPLNEKSRGNVYNNEISFLKEEMNCVENANTNMNNNNHNTRNGKKLRYSNSFISFAKGLNRSMNIKEESINRLDTKDNLKLKNINCEMKNKLQQQTNQEFLMKNKLPDIRLIANGSDVVRKIRNGLCKQLGEKYDPFAYVIEKPQIKGRNYYGGLFKY
jgi:hypothetical protein